MSTSHLHILPNTSFLTLTTCNFNCREIGGGWVLSGLTCSLLSRLTLSHVSDCPDLQRRDRRTLSLLHILTQHHHSYATSSFLLPLLPIAQQHQHSLMPLSTHHQNRQKYLSSKLLPHFPQYLLTTIPQFHDETPSPLSKPSLTTSQFSKLLMDT